MMIFKGKFVCLLLCTLILRFTYACAPGYVESRSPSGVTCVDYNECTNNDHSCQHPATCVNDVGSYHCACPPGYELDSSDSTYCVETDPCVSGSWVCGANQMCVNDMNDGVQCKCAKGYAPANYDPDQCVDIDECSSGISRCYGATCRNDPGSYHCECGMEGYVWNDKASQCQRPSFCASGAYDCISPAYCIDDLGSSKGYQCGCPVGYGLSIYDGGKSCDDINECTTGVATCDSRATCVNDAGTYHCVCPNGYSLTAENTCVGANACDSGVTNCAGLSTCVNDGAGAYHCACPNGYNVTSNGKNCMDFNECTNDAHSCTGTAICVNDVGSYHCVCPNGHYPSNDGKSCSAPIPCTKGCGKGQCDTKTGMCNCAGTGQTGPTCNIKDCPSGYKPNAANTQCIDINECADGSNMCGAHSICKNTAGSYSCPCLQGYTGNGLTQCSAVCANECKNGGSCTAPGKCTCAAGWTGATCTTSLCSKSCHAGRCVGKDTCDCSGTGFTGPYCTVCPKGFEPNADYTMCTDINECMSTATYKCADDASCNNVPGGYTCSCNNGYSGDGYKTCYPVCPNLCQHGQCTAPNKCTCEAGWTGPECTISTCPKGCGQGVCVGNNKCDCKGTGFKGPTCNKRA